MVDDLSTAQDYVVTPSPYFTRVDLADAYAFAVGLVLAAIFSSYFNRRYW